MTHTITSKMLLAPAALVVGLFGMTGSAKAATWDHVDLMALRLQHQTQELHEEASRHFQNTPVYKSFDETVCKMTELAAHIHNVARARQCVRTLSQDVGQLRQLQYQAERTFLTLGQWGQLNPVAYRHLGDSLRDSAATISLLRRDLRTLEHNQFQNGGGHGVGYPPVTQPYPQPVPQPIPPVGGCPSARGVRVYPQVIPPQQPGISLRVGYRRW